MNIGTIIRTCIIAVVITTQLGASPSVRNRSTAAGTSTRYMPGLVIVKVRAAKLPGPGSAAHTLSKTAAIASIMQRYSAIGARQPFLTPSKPLAQDEEEFSRIYELTVPSPMNIPAMVRELQKDPTVEYAEPKYVYRTQYQPNDPFLSSLWHLTTIFAQQAWDITKGDSTVIIGLVDSGTDVDHPDLTASVWTNPGETGLDAQGHDKQTNNIDDDHNGFIDDWQGWDFVGSDAVPFAPDNGINPHNANNEHGTHTAGIAAAVTDNGIGIAGVGFRTKLMITKHGIDGGDDFIYNADDGILYCINNGASIVSCSWGGASASEFERDVIRYGLKKNVLIVASAGNGGDDQLSDDIAVLPSYPGAYPGVLNVGATDQNDRLTYFSNYGSAPLFKVLAPGWNIFSTLPNKSYGMLSGTSMSTPMAAGVAALVKSVHPSWNAAQLMFQVCGTADNIDAKNDPKYAGKLGYGRINVYRAVTEVAPTPGPDLAFVSASIDDSNGGNGNNTLEPGETASIIVTIENQWGDAQNVTASLETSSWAATISKSTSTYGFLPGIAKIDSATRSNAADPFRITISPQAIPTVIPLILHVTASNSPTKDFPLTLSVLPSVLLVDDDDGVLNVESYYETALQSLGVVYERWDHSVNGTPPIDLMMRYKTVIWFTEWNVPTLDSTDRAVLATYLNSGGKKLFMSGEENGWDLCGVDGPEFLSSGGASQVFYETYLKGKFVADDAGTDSVQGVPGDEIGGGLLFTRDQPGRGTGQNPDVIDPVNGASPIFSYAGGSFPGRTAGVKYKGTYALVSLSFGGYEAITDSAQRQTVMDRVLRYLYGYNIVVNQLPDFPAGPYTVNATVTTADPSPTVELLWSIDGALPYHRVAMTQQTPGLLTTGGSFTSTITPSPGKRIDYFVLVKTADGFLPYAVHHFAVNIPTTVTRTDAVAPREFALAQNYPNPFNPTTQIRFSIAETRFVSLTVFDALGREVSVLVNEVKVPGEYTIAWNGAGLASGVYYYRLTAGAYTSIHKMTLLR